MYQNNKSKDATDFAVMDNNLFDIVGLVYAKWKKNKWTISGGLRYDNRHLQGKDFYKKSNNITGFD